MIIVYFLFFIIFLFFIQYILNINKDKNNCKIIKYYKNLPKPVIIIDILHNRIADYNDDAENLFNLNIEYVKNLSIFDNFDDYLAIKNNIRDSIEGDFITQNIMLKNSLYSIHYTIIRENNKKFLCILFDDISNKFDYLKNLGIFSSIIEESPDGIILAKYIDYNKSPIIIYMNKTLEEITGYNRFDVIQKPLNSLFEMNVDEKTLQNIEKNIYSLRPSTLDYQYINKFGEINWVVTDIIPVNNINISNSLKVLDKMNILKKIEGYNNIDNLGIDIFISIHQKDITDVKHYENSSKSFISRLQNTLKEKITFHENIVRSIISILNTNVNNTMIINDVLKIIGELFNADRCYIFKLYEKKDYLYMDYLYEWVEEGITPEINNPTLSNISFSDVGAYDLYANLISNRISKIIVSDIKDPALKFTLDAQNIKSMIACPIFKEEKLVGYIGIDDCTNEDRNWDTQVELVLRKVSDSLSNFIH